MKIPMEADTPEHQLTLATEARAKPIGVSMMIDHEAGFDAQEARATNALHRVLASRHDRNEHTFDAACEAPTDWSDAFGMVGER